MGLSRLSQATFSLLPPGEMLSLSGDSPVPNPQPKDIKKTHWHSREAAVGLRYRAKTYTNIGITQRAKEPHGLSFRRFILLSEPPGTDLALYSYPPSSDSSTTPWPLSGISWAEVTQTQTWLPGGSRGRAGSDSVDRGRRACPGGFSSEDGKRTGREGSPPGELVFRCSCAQP